VSPERCGERPAATSASASEVKVSWAVGAYNAHCTAGLATHNIGSNNKYWDVPYCSFVISCRNCEELICTEFSSRLWISRQI